jgi:hypothetical protein
LSLPISKTLGVTAKCTTKPERFTTGSCVTGEPCAFGVGTCHAERRSDKSRD